MLRDDKRNAAILAAWIDGTCSAARARTDAGVSLSTLYRWKRLVQGLPRTKWAAALQPILRSSGRPSQALPTEAMAYLKWDYLHKVRPSLKSSYDRAQQQASLHGWTPLPSYATVARRLRDEIAPDVITLAREGEIALAQQIPPQERTVRHLRAGEWLSGDGYQPKAYIRWDDGSVSRPWIWTWEDIYSRKAIVWKLDRSESAELVRTTLRQVIEQIGIPFDCTIDNTRGAANKWLSGGIRHRYRFKVKPWEPAGAFLRLGIEPHWTHVVDGQGWGQGKPIERRHRDWRDRIDKDPAFRDHWHERTALDEATYRAEVDRLITESNDRPGRQTETGQGTYSFSQAFDQSFATAVPRWPTPDQLRLCMLAAQPVTVSKQGIVTLKTGYGPVGKTRYTAEHDELLAYQGDKVALRFEPEDLLAQVEIETLDGAWICTATRLDPAPYGSIREGHRQAALHKQRRNTAKKQLEIERQLAALPGSTTPPAPLPTAVNDTPASPPVKPPRPLKLVPFEDD